MLTIIFEFVCISYLLSVYSLLMKWCEALFLILSWYGQWRVFCPSTEMCTTYVRFENFMLESSCCIRFWLCANQNDVRAFKICDPIEIWISLHFGFFLVFTKMLASPIFEKFHEKMNLPYFIKDHFYDDLWCQGH